MYITVDIVERYRALARKAVTLPGGFPARPRPFRSIWSPSCWFLPPQQPQDPPAQKGPAITTKVRRTMSSRVHEAVKAIALCHNVTPVYESNGVTDQAEAEKQYEDSCRVYQASSPDEVNSAQAQRCSVHLSRAPGGAARGSHLSGQPAGRGMPGC